MPAAGEREYTRSVAENRGCMRFEFATIKPVSLSRSCTRRILDRDLLSSRTSPPPPPRSAPPRASPVRLSRPVRASTFIHTSRIYLLCVITRLTTPFHNTSGFSAESHRLSDCPEYVRVSEIFLESFSSRPVPHLGCFLLAARLRSASSPTARALLASHSRVFMHAGPIVITIKRAFLVGWEI